MTDLVKFAEPDSFRFRLSEETLFTMVPSSRSGKGRSSEADKIGSTESNSQRVLGYEETLFTMVPSSRSGKGRSSEADKIGSTEIDVGDSVNTFKNGHAMSQSNRCALPYWPMS